jgi:hypothetical protein
MLVPLQRPAQRNVMYTWNFMWMSEAVTLHKHFIVYVLEKQFSITFSCMWKPVALKSL